MTLLIVSLVIFFREFYSSTEESESVSTPCHFESGFVSLEEIRNCIDSYPSNNSLTELTELPKILAEYLESYVFLDQIRNPPSPHTNSYIDIAQDLLSVTYGENDTPYSFYMKLVKLIGKLHDPHTSFTPPCFDRFSFVLPFEFTVETSYSENNESTYIVKAIPNQAHTDLTYEWINKNVNLVGKQITHILNEEGTYEDALTYISRWSRENIVISRYQHARFNFALNGIFSNRLASQYEMPNETLQITYLESEKESRNATLEWFGYVHAPVENISEMCPLNSEKRATNEGSNRVDIPQGGAADLSQEFYQKQELKQQAAAWRYLQKRLLPPGSPAFLSLKEADEKLEAELAYYQHDEMMNTNRTITQSNGDLFRILIDDSELQFIVVPPAFLGYIRIRTWSPKLPSSFMSRVVLGLKELIDEYNCSACILDLRMNTGGDIGLAMEFHHLLFPSDYPYYGTYKMRKSRLNGELSKRFGVAGVDAETQEVFDTISEFYNKTVSEHYLDVETNQLFTANYTRRYEFHAGLEKYSDFLSLWDTYPGYSGAALFSPQRLLVLTDGICGSSCCTVIKHIHEERRGRILGVGFDPLSKDSDEYDSGSFCGGLVRSSELIDSVREKLNYSNFPPPFPRSGTTLTFTQMAIHTWNKSTTYDSQTIQNGTNLLEFRVNPVDAIAPNLFPNSMVDSTSVGTMATILGAIPFYEGCFEWEVRDASENCSSSVLGASGSHEVYGHPCVAGQFDTSLCVFSRCSDGYYLNGTKDDQHHKSGTCVPSPAIPVRSPTGSAKVTIWSIVVISLLGVLLLISVLVIVFLCICRQRYVRDKSQTEMKAANDLELQVPLHR